MTGPLHILLVEDHADSARALARLLHGQGHTVSHADGYAAAMRLAQERRFDLLLIDLGLPDGDGCDLLNEVRACYPVPAIAITGHGMAPDVRRCRDAGFEHHLLKPLSLPRLVGAIERLAAPVVCPDTAGGEDGARPTEHGRRDA